MKPAGLHHKEFWFPLIRYQTVLQYHKSGTYTMFEHGR